MRKILVTNATPVPTNVLSVNYTDEQGQVSEYFLKDKF